MPKLNQTPRSGTLKIFGGSSHPEMTKLIARKVGARVGDVVLGKFSNKETQVELKENVRGQDIYVVQTAGGKTPNDHLMELLFLINALRLAAASNIVVITPFFFYSKGDQKDGYRVPITSKLVGSLLKKAGATHLMLLDPHTPQVEGFFDLIVDTLKVEPLFCEWVRLNVIDWQHCLVVSPDEGGAKRSVSLANDLVLDFAIISNRNKTFEKDANHHHNLCVHKKRRKKRCDSESTTKDSSAPSSNVDPNDIPDLSRSNSEVADPSASFANLRLVERSTSPECNGTTTRQTQTDCRDVMTGHLEKSKRSKPIGHLSSSVNNRNVIIIDDMIDTGNTIEFALETLQRGGAKSVTILVTHGVFSKAALRIIESYGDFVKAVVVTNSISQTEKIEKGRLKDKLHVLDVSGLIAEFVRRHHYNESVSVLGRFMPIRDSYAGHKAQNHRPEEPFTDTDTTQIEDEIFAEDLTLNDDANGDESQSDLEESVGPEDVETARRQILDPSASQKLRKGFRMASICWDD